MTSFLIFSLSIILSISTLFIERAVGIDWDFHPDAFTYSTNSNAFVEKFYDNPLVIVNGAHYLWVSILGSSVSLVVAFNMFFWGITNAILCNSLLDKLKERGSFFLWGVFIIFLFSPYRLHLSTTVLKDTIIILLLTCIFALKSKWLPIGLIFIWRAASIFYFVSLFSRKIFLLSIFFALLFTFFNFGLVLEYAEKIDGENMNFRDFDNIPSFKEYEFIGTLLRMLLWPVLAFTGSYAVISPSVFFFPLAMGSIASLVLSYFVSSKINFLVLGQILLGMSFFAFFATGFTTYLRYVYPFISIFPLILLYHENRFNCYVRR